MVITCARRVSVLLIDQAVTVATPLANCLYMGFYYFFEALQYWTHTRLDIDDVQKKDNTEGRLTLLLPPRRGYVKREVHGDVEHKI